ncbi:conserved hypothetical protein [Nesidiocoris tenuis]|uniref:Uncharacterized protein n=1 Tax=Nesidiocoris tenuis TaxID=355587 RepID=A0ABN7B0E8_9HEMI|nr:conserved hypothetical protein [Nesidiocoris tenuis]
MEQWNRRNAVEIWGIPTTENEDLMKLTERIFNAIKWTVSIKDQLDNVVRIPKSDEEFAIGKKIVKLSGPSVPKSVLWINFLSGRGKDAFVNHWKSVERNGRLTLTQLGFRQDGQVKMESSLTSNKLKLFQKALEHAKKFQYRRVGVLNGEVYLLRDSRSGPLVYVKSTQELEEMEIAEGTDGRKTLKIAENSSRTTDVY